VTDRIIIRGGRVIDPARGIDDVRDVLAEDRCTVMVDRGSIVEGGCVFYPPVELGDVLASLRRAMSWRLMRTRRERSVAGKGGAL